MAIRKRTPKNTQDAEDSKPVNVQPIEFVTWKEQACFVLDELEKTGINIYDDSRTPGMYLSQRSDNQKIPNKLFSTIKEQSNSQVSNTSPKEEISQNLINFLKSQK